MNFLDHQKSINQSICFFLHFSFFSIGLPDSLKEAKDKPQEMANTQTNTEAEIILIPGN